MNSSTESRAYTWKKKAWLIWSNKWIIRTEQPWNLLKDCRIQERTRWTKNSLEKDKGLHKMRIALDVCRKADNDGVRLWPSTTTLLGVCWIKVTVLVNMVYWKWNAIKITTGEFVHALRVQLSWANTIQYDLIFWSQLIQVILETGH